MPGRPIRRKFLKDVKDRGGWEAVFDRIASGETQKRIAESFGISQSFFCRVLREDEGRRALQAEAKKEGAQALADEALAIADGAPVDRDALTKARLQIEHRRWMAQNLDREQFGDRQGEVTVNIGQLHLDAVRVRAVPSVPLVIESPPLLEPPPGSETDDAA